MIDDVISRQKAIDVAKDLIIPGADYLQHNQAVNNYAAELVQLPPAQPEQRWTLCSKQPPEEDGEYLVLYYTRSKFKPYVYDVISFANDLYKIDEYDFPDKKGQKGWFYCDRDYGYCEDNSVYAWMSLPEPWRGEQE